MAVVPWQKSPWQLYKQKWSNCTLCDCCKHRKKVVLYRGPLPCKTLMVGEAPGPSEDTIGQPFIGPAGKLLAQIIFEAYQKVEGSIEQKADRQLLSIGFTNIVACIPKGDDGNKFTEPSDESIKACRDRYRECVELAKPKAIVYVGSVANTKGRLGLIDPKNEITIVHPAAILRAPEENKGLLIKEAIVKLRDLFERL